MTTPSSAQTRLLLLFSLLLAAGAICGQPPSSSLARNGTLTLLNDFSQGYGQPRWLVEVSPGTFAGIAIASSPGGNAFLLTSQGALKSIYAFPLNAGPIQTLVQAVNGRLYGEQGAPDVNFSFDIGGQFPDLHSSTSFVP
jgi:hypothetical protein